MRVVRGRRECPKTDRTFTERLVSTVSANDEGVLRVWQPPRQVAFGRRDTNRSGYERARQILSERGIPSVERSVGGHAVFVTGTTVSFLRATPVEDGRSSITDRYEAVLEDVRSALAQLDVDATEGEPAGAFCPGAHSLSAEGKVVGLAQRVQKDIAIVSGIVVVQDHEEINELLGPVYSALELPFDPAATGSLARAGGESDPAAVCRGLEATLTTGEPTVERVRET